MSGRAPMKDAGFRGRDANVRPRETINDANRKH